MKEILNPTIQAVLLGLLVSIACSYVHYKLIEFSIKKAIKDKATKLISFSLLTIAKQFMLALPLLICLIFPKNVSVLAVMIGLIVSKFIFILYSYRRSGGK